MTLASMKKNIREMAQIFREGEITSSIRLLCMRQVCILILDNSFLDIGLTEVEKKYLWKTKQEDFPGVLKEVYGEYFIIHMALLLVLEKY